MNLNVVIHNMNYTELSKRHGVIHLYANDENLYIIDIMSYCASCSISSYTLSFVVECMSFTFI